MNLEERTYTSPRDVRPGDPAGQADSGGRPERDRRRHPAAEAGSELTARRKTPAQKVASVERAAQRERHRLSKAERRHRTHAMCVLAGAIAAELKRDQTQAPWVLDMLQRRVTKAHDLTAVMQWLSTI